MRIEDGFTDLVLTSHAGLPAFAQVLKAARLWAVFGSLLNTIPDADIFTTATTLLALGKCDFESSAYRDDPSFTRRLGLKRLPSAEILRQRLDQAPAEVDARRSRGPDSTARASARRCGHTTESAAGTRRGA
jgi:hypothetical protein